MPSPFPGMDPYLEDPDLWLDVHHWLISMSAEQLQPQVTPRGYYVAVEQRVWLESPEKSMYPDLSVEERRPPPSKNLEREAVLLVDEPVLLPLEEVERREWYLNIHELGSQRLITGIEFVSPSNKSRTESREQYLRKRRKFAQAGINLVEVDLLRAGRPLLRLPPAVLRPRPRVPRYLINIIRPGSSDYEFYPVPIRQRLPRVRIPLKTGEPDAVLDLQAALARAYDAGAYALRIDYNQPPVPPLRGDDASWADALLVAAGLRTTPL